MATAFCSYHDSTRLRGRLLTSVSRALARAVQALQRHLPPEIVAEILRREGIYDEQSWDIPPQNFLAMVEEGHAWRPE